MLGLERLCNTCNVTPPKRERSSSCYSTTSLGLWQVSIHLLPNSSDNCRWENMTKQSGILELPWVANANRLLPPPSPKHWERFLYHSIGGSSFSGCFLDSPFSGVSFLGRKLGFYFGTLSRIAKKSLYHTVPNKYRSWIFMTLTMLFLSSIHCGVFLPMQALAQWYLIIGRPWSWRKACEDLGGAMVFGYQDWFLVDDYPPWNLQLAPQNGWLEDEFPFGMAYFQGLC